jgi:hypothetical protein
MSAALQEVIDLRRQVAGRLRAVAQGRDFDQLWSSFDAWRQWTLLKHLGRLAVLGWEAKAKARYGSAGICAQLRNAPPPAIAQLPC